MANTLNMAGGWLVVAFLIPGVVHQWISMENPANLMTEFIDAGRDEREKLFQQPDRVLQARLNAMFPEIVDSPVARDSTKHALARNRSASALANELKKASISLLEADNQAKNERIRSTYWFNPIAFFQNRLNAVSETHYDDYQAYRDQIQTLIDKQIRTMVLDTWNAVEVDKEQYLAYHKILTQ
jgi:ABC-2 type transport system permease protein